MRLKSLLHPIKIGLNRRRMNFYRSSAFNSLVDSDPQKALETFWKIQKQYPLDWNHPQTIDEKIFWLEGMTDTSLWTEYSDKYQVRKHIEEIGLSQYLAKLYGVWENADEIDFLKLPDNFVLKCNHDCGSAIIVHDKSQINVEEIKAKLNNCLQKKYGYKTCEPHYTRIHPLIIAEELIEPKNQVFASNSLIDYKFFCFNGEPLLCLVCYNRESGHVLKDLYQVDGWQRYKNTSELYKNQDFPDVVPQPDSIEEMLSIASRISAGFPFLRVDLYNAAGRIYFGEMTFTPHGGILTCFNETAQYELGRLIPVP